MNNEPVAVYINKDDGLVCAKCFNPLYTHPAKTLTDDEIKQVMSEFYSYNPRLLDFARAILRKAQEK